MVLRSYRGSRLDQIVGTTNRRPAWRVVIWNPNQTTVQDVTRGAWSGLSLDVSAWCSQVKVNQNQVFETGTDAVSSRATVVVEVEDNQGVTVGGQRILINQKLFRDGTPIRIYEGDRRIGRSSWLPVFTGVIRGTPSADVASRGRRKMSLSCFGRAQAYQRQGIVGLNWDYGTDLGDMAVDVAMVEMGLTREEIRFGQFDYVTRHKANALTQIGKMQGLYEIMRVVERAPYFDAEGYLVSHDLSLFKPPAFTLSPKSIVSMKRVQQVSQFVNSTEVIGLDHRLTKVANPLQAIAEVNATVGYFDSHYRENIWYSEDRTRRAQNTFIKVLTNHGHIDGDVSWREIDEFHGQLVIDTGWAPEVFGLFVLAWAISSIVEYICDYFLDTVGNVPYWTEPAVEIRREAQMVKAATMLAIQYAMATLGRFRVVVYGEVYENVHQELRAIASLTDVPTADVFERKEVMHWVTTIEKARDMAKNMLRREQVKAHEYEITMPSLPALEVDDVVEVDTGGQYGFTSPARFYVTSISRTYKRGPSDALMTIRCWHCLESPTP